MKLLCSLGSLSCRNRVGCVLVSQSFGIIHLIIAELIANFCLTRNKDEVEKIYYN